MKSTADKKIRLINLLKEKCVSLDLEAADKRGVIKELVELINGVRKLKNKSAFFKAMLERERMGSTGIGNGVAIPHVKSKLADDFIIIFARKKEGIDFGALDGENTYLFFALASPLENVGGHLKILSEISRLVKDKFIVECLKKAETKKDVLNIINRYQV